MKLIGLFGAAALAAGTVITVTPAEAQRYGWHDRGPGPGPGWRHGPRWDRGRGWDRGPRWGRSYRRPHYGYGYGYGGGYGRGRVVCHIERGYYGPVRRCFRR